MGFKRPMACRWTGDDLYARLNGSIILHRDRAVLVHVKSSSTVALHPLGSSSTPVPGWSSVDVEDLDVSVPLVGYFMQGDKACYASRLPHRKYVQGLTPSNVFYRPLGQGDFTMKSATPMNRHILQGQEFGASLEGTFPRITDVSPGAQSCALSRDVALAFSFSGEARVFIRQREVGWIKPGQKTVTLKDSPLVPTITMFLKECGLRHNLMKGSDSIWIR